MVEFNLFATIPPSTDPKIVNRHRCLTRAYLIFLFTFLFIIVLYTVLRQETITAIVESPSVSKYRDLFSRYPVTLQCPCSRTEIKYNKFISQIELQYHQICSSVFVSLEWINSMPDPGVTFLLINYDSDFQMRLRLYFETLSKLCALSRKTLNTSLSIFVQTDFITAHVISRAEFDIRTEVIVEQFKTTVPNQFMDTLKLMQVISQGNQLASLFSTNWKFFLNYTTASTDFTDGNLIDVLARPETYGAEECSCGVQSNCSKSIEFPFRISNQSLSQSLPGFLVGCLPFESLLQSSLTCLYNRTCMDILRASMYKAKPIPYELLIYSSSSTPNTTIEILLSRLFVSAWFPKTSFDLYFNECAPELCQYSYIMRYDTVYVLTTLIALFGGLTNGLRFVVYYIGFVVYAVIDRRKQKNQVEPYSSRSDAVVIDEDHNNTAIMSNPIRTTVEVIIVDYFCQSLHFIASGQCS